METVFSEDHRLRRQQSELGEGMLVPPFEIPERADRILDTIRETGLGGVRAPVPRGREAALRLHNADYVDFLETAWDAWSRRGYTGDAMATVWPAGRNTSPAPETIEGLLGHYAFAAETSITQGTWPAVRSAVDVALTAASLVSEGAPAAFALCRPPGHHAPAGHYGGYCFFNNAALAAQDFLDRGAERVAVLDVDFHHGNGTQSMFYGRSDVLMISIHGDPLHTFPYYWGHAGENGEGSGEGWNANYPLPPDTAWDVWSAALEAACHRIEHTAPDALVISLGVDTYAGDPMGSFRLGPEDFLRYGERIGRLRLPTLFVMEGGYAVDRIGEITVNVLRGFEDA